MTGFSIINLEAGIYDLVIYDSNYNEFIIEANQSNFLITTTKQIL